VFKASKMAIFSSAFLAAASYASFTEKNEGKEERCAGLSML